MTVGFLLGAGFSKALHPSMPLLRDLLQQIEIPDDVPQSIRGDLEQTLSYLWTNYPWNTEAQHLKNKYHFLELNQQIYRAITKAEFIAWSELYDNNPLRITSRRINANSKVIWQAQLAGVLSNHERFFSITMNYDTLLERLMMMNNEANLVYPAPLQRLNGIWNQYESLPTPTFHSSIFEDRFKSYPLQPSLFKLHGSVSWYSLDPLEANAPIYCIEMDKNYTLDKKVITHEIDNALTSIIVPPVADKSSLYNNKVLRSQWVGASQALQGCDTLYCVGYSFPQSDLPMELFLGQACGNIKRVVLVNLNKDEGTWTRIKKLFADDVEVEWITGDDSVKKMAYRLFGEEN